MMQAGGDRPWRTPTCWSPTSATVENETPQAHSKQAGRRQSGLQIKKVSAKKINTQLQRSWMPDSPPWQLHKLLPGGQDD